jgi:hypothetical protein
MRARQLALALKMGRKRKMPTFLLERVIPLAFNINDPDQVALHSRWALDAYQAAGISWLGGVATDGGKMFGLVVADNADAVHSYCKSIGVGTDDYKLSGVVTSIGPHMALDRTDPRYRPLKRPT